MTAWSLTLRVDRLDEGESTPVTEAAVASMSSPDPRTVAAVLRATADQLDPPRPAYRSAADRRGAADQRFRDKLAGYGDQPSGGTRGWTSTSGPLSGNAYDAQCRGSDCFEGHTYLTGCALAPSSGRRGTRAGACDQPGHGITGCACASDVVDTPGDRMDAPDAQLSTEGAKRVRRPGSRITPDGCGPEHTYTGSCALAGTPLPVVGEPITRKAPGTTLTPS